jgi:hypothetical protein
MQENIRGNNLSFQSSLQSNGQNMSNIMDPLILAIVQSSRLIGI